MSPQEGQQIQRIVRRGGGKTDKSHVKWRRALVVHASAGGNTVPVIAQLAATSEDRVREMIHRFNELGMRSLDPQWAGGRPRQITTDDEAFIVETAKPAPRTLGQPFTRWSIRKLVAYLADNDVRVVEIGRERLRQILAAHDITFQRTKTWKESNDPDRDAKLDRIEQVLDQCPDRTFAFDEFGPLAIRPTGGSRGPRPGSRSVSRRTTTSCTGSGSSTAATRSATTSCGVWSGTAKARPTRSKALRSIRARRPDGDRIYVILDNLSAHKGPTIRDWATATRSSCASRRPTARGPTRSRPTSGHYASSC